MEYKINGRNTRRVLRGTLIYHLLFVIFYAYAMYALDRGNGIYTSVFLIGYIVSMAPTVILFIEYYLINKRDIMCVNLSEKNIITNSRIISFNEIEKITLYMPHRWHRKNGTVIFPFEDYRYAKIQMKFSDPFLFTTLMDFHLDKVMNNIHVPIEKKVRQIASPTLERIYSYLYGIFF